MATVIDELILRIGFDPSELSSGEKAVISQLDSIQKSVEGVADAFNQSEKDSSKALEKTAKNTEKSTKQIQKHTKEVAGFFGSIRKEILALAGITLTLTGVQSFVTDMSNNLRGLSINAKAFGMTAKSLDAWGRTFEQGGAGRDDANNLLSRINQSRTTLKSGYGIDDFGLGLYEFAGGAGANIDLMNMSTEQIGEHIAEALSRLSPEQQQYWGSRMGMNSASIQTMSQGNFKDMIKEAKATSNATDELVESNRRFYTSLKKTKQTIESISQTIMAHLLPYLEKFNEWLNGLAKWVKENPEKIKEAFDTLTNGALDLAQRIKGATDAVGGWSNAIKLLVGVGIGGAFLTLLSSAAALMKSMAVITFNPAFLAALAAAGGGYMIGEKLRETSFGQKIMDAGAEFLDNITGETDKKYERMRQDQEYSYNAWKRSQGNPPNQPVTPQTLQSYAATPASTAERTRVGKENRAKIEPHIRNVESKYGLPSGLLVEVARTESGFFADRVSHAGARGMFQFMPDTQKDMGLSDTDVFDPYKSADAAGRYMKQLMKRYNNDIEKAVAAYNWGMGNVDKGLGGAPKETRNYMTSVIGGLQKGYTYESRFSDQSSSLQNHFYGDITVQSDKDNVNGLVNDISSTYGVNIISFASGVG